MIIEQIIDIPADRRIFLDLPPELPVGKAKVTVTSETESIKTRTPISHYFGIISPDTYGDGVAYQRKLRDEWGE
jgi:hypothetical protein